MISFPIQYSEKIKKQRDFQVTHNRSSAALLDIVTTTRSQYVWKSLQCKLTHCLEIDEPFLYKIVYSTLLTLL